MKRPLMRVMLCFDSLFVAMNCILGHLFGLKEIYLFGGEKFFELITYPLFYIHYGIVMMLALFCLISLFYGAFKAPYFLSKKIDADCCGDVNTGCIELFYAYDSN